MKNGGFDVFELLWSLTGFCLAMVLLLAVVPLLRRLSQASKRGDEWLLSLVNGAKWAMVIVTVLVISFVARSATSGGSPNASRHKTESFLMAIKSGLEAYRSDFGEYPRPKLPKTFVKFGSVNYDISGALMLYQVLSGDGTDAIDCKLPPRASNGKIDDEELPYMKLTDMPRDMWKRIPEGYIIVDGYGHPVQYESANAETLNHTYDLWSFGTKPSRESHQGSEGKQGSFEVD